MMAHQLWYMYLVFGDNNNRGGYTWTGGGDTWENSVPASEFFCFCVFLVFKIYKIKYC